MSILSLLTLKERQRTSVLSKRWRYLWTFTTCRLDFNDSRSLSLVRRKTSDQQNFSHNCIVLAIVENIESERRNRFVSWVNSVLELHQGNTIDEFRVVFDMDGRKFKSEIDNWICFSLRKKVKKLTLDFMMDGVANAYTLTSQIFHSCSLDSLTDLSLASVEVTGEVLEYVLSNCPFIEILHVENSNSLVKLKTSSPLPKLKHLVLNCRFLKQIQISAINLVSFKYSGLYKRIKILLGDVPNFVDLYVKNVTDDCFHYFLQNDCPLSRYLSQLETLELDLFTTVSHKFHCELHCAFSFFIHQRLYVNVFLFLGSIVQDSFQVPKFPELRNLRQLKLDIYPCNSSLRCCVSLLNASPVLHRFVLKVMLIILEFFFFFFCSR